MANKKSSIIPDKSTVCSMVEEYQNLSKQEKLLSSRKKLLAESIKAYAMQNGTKDDKGSFYVENDNFIFGAQCRKSVSLDEVKALKFFEEKGIYDNVVDLKPVINENKVEEYLAIGDITVEDIMSISKEKVTMAIDVRVKDDIVTVQESTASIAAQKKRPLLKKKK